MDRTHLLVATRNQHKTEEISALLGGSFQVSDSSALPDAPEVEETGKTFLENATLKAVAISVLTESLVVADDSGLEVDGLEGAPGVYSARYAGSDASDVQNNEKLLQELRTIPAAGRSARFRCVLVVAQAGKVLADFGGAVEGRILEHMEGEAGFGYDPLFAPTGYDHSFAVLGPEVKNGLSHRARAIAKLVQWLHEQ